MSYLDPVLCKTEPSVLHTIPPVTQLSVDADNTSSPPSLMHTIQREIIHQRTQHRADADSTTVRLLIVDQRREPNDAAVLVGISGRGDAVGSSSSIVHHRQRPTPLLPHLNFGTVPCTLARAPHRALADRIQKLLLQSINDCVRGSSLAGVAQ